MHKSLRRVRLIDLILQQQQQVRVHLLHASILWLYRASLRDGGQQQGGEKHTVEKEHSLYVLCSISIDQLGTRYHSTGSSRAASPCSGSPTTNLILDMFRQASSRDHKLHVSEVKYTGTVATGKLEKSKGMRYKKWEKKQSNLRRRRRKMERVPWRSTAGKYQAFQNSWSSDHRRYWEFQYFAGSPPANSEHTINTCRYASRRVDVRRILPAVKITYYRANLPFSLV